MEKLVIVIEKTDNSTYSFTEHYPFPYKSKEKFEEDILEHLMNSKLPFNTGSFDIDYDDLNMAFVSNNIYTLDEWFDKFS